MIVPPDSARLGRNLDLRLNSAQITIGENIVIDDDVRIVVPETGQLSIGDNVKIGKGTVLNCGGRVAIGNDVAFYGYCYLQSSRWIWENGEKTYSYFDIRIEPRATLAPFTTISGNVTVPSLYRGVPNEVLGTW